MNIIAGTGHRPNKLGGYSDKVFYRLVDLAKASLAQYKPDIVISGMALGWDQALAEAATRLKIPFIAAVPFIGQENSWPEDSQDYYMELLDQASEIITVSDGGYHPRKMQLRNIWMVDRSEKILALWDGSRGGTFNCVQYALSKKKPVINMWNSWMKYNYIDRL
jgi:uncharacterized phage-like protein YoqJ